MPAPQEMSARRQEAWPAVGDLQATTASCGLNPAEAQNGEISSSGSRPHPCAHTTDDLAGGQAHGARHKTCWLRRSERRAPYRVAEQLRARIESGAYRSGEKLPIEQALLAEFSVSRGALREALVILECQGLIVSHPGTGSRIAAPAPLLREMIAGRVDCIAVLEACSLFETEAASLAARLGGDAWPEPLPEEGCTLLENSRRFHVALAAATGNSAVWASIRDLWGLLCKRSELGDLLNTALTQVDKSVVELRRMLINAVVKGDPEDARGRMRALFTCYLEAVLKVEEDARLAQARRQSLTRREAWRYRLAHQNRGLQGSG